MTSLARSPAAPHTLSLSHSSTSELAATVGTDYSALAGSKPLTLKSLLETPVEFVRPKHQLRDEDVPYKPINHKSVAPSSSSLPLPSTSASTSTSTSTTTTKASLFPPIDPSPSWARPFPVGSGLQNVGNTCFLNSALQCLLHTPPLVRYLLNVGGGASNGHPIDEKCGMKQKKGFCMSCAMRGLIKQSFGGGGGGQGQQQRKSSYTPGIVVKNLKAIAKHLRFGRQEDSHEFLRFVIDGMQLSSLHGKSPKLTLAQKNQNPIHQLFGGTLRSRVHCTSCLHNSDTFDAMLDLSLDLGNRATSVKEGLDNLVRVDHLRGQNRYRCEKCKKLVNAEKQFTIEKAPLVLTIHLKRFTPTGRKVSGLIKYPETLNLKGYMSDSSQSPSYKLYAIILHSGSGPHSGHYTALVRSGQGKWYDMNDDLVSPINNNNGGAPLGQRNAYCLFYVREKGDQLKEIITRDGNSESGGGGGGGKKRKRESLNGSSSISGGGGVGGGTTSTGGTPIQRKLPSSEEEEEGVGSPVGKKARSSSSSSNNNDPQPPRVLTASKKSAPSSPKLSTSFNPFETTRPITSEPAVPTTTPTGGGKPPTSFSDLELKAIQQRLNKKNNSVKEFQSRSSSQHQHHGGGGGNSGGKGKIANRLKPRSKNHPKMLK